MLRYDIQENDIIPTQLDDCGCSQLRKLEYTELKNVIKVVQYMTCLGNALGRKASIQQQQKQSNFQPLL